MDNCKAPGCPETSTHDSDVGRLCQHHFMAWRRHGHIGSQYGPTCTVDGCGKKHLTGGLCTMHYARKRKTGSTDDAPRKNARKVCSVEGCGINSQADGLCDTHYRRLRRYGTTDIPTKPVPHPKLCAVCGGERPSRRIAFCSDECAQHSSYHTRKATARSRDLRKYGITVEDYEQMLSDQGGGCRICGTDTPGSGRGAFAIDHDHETGRVRGVLCLTCNSGLGQFKDSPELLRRAVEYLSGRLDSVP